MKLYNFTYTYSSDNITAEKTIKGRDREHAQQRFDTLVTELAGLERSDIHSVEVTEYTYRDHIDHAVLQFLHSLDAEGTAETYYNFIISDTYHRECRRWANRVKRYSGRSLQQIVLDIKLQILQCLLHNLVTRN